MIVMMRVLVFLLALTAVNVFAESVSKMDVGQLSLTIDREVQEYMLPISSESAKSNNFTELVNLVEKDIIEFSSSTAYDFSDVIVLLGEIYDRRVVSSFEEVGRTKSMELTEEYVNSVLELTKERLTLTTLSMVQTAHYSLVAITKDGRTLNDSLDNKKEGKK